MLESVLLAKECLVGSALNSNNLKSCWPWPRLASSHQDFAACHGFGA